MTIKYYLFDGSLVLIGHRQSYHYPELRQLRGGSLSGEQMLCLSA